ncbi:putative transcriptional regulator LysR (plasmid) [Sinorhizobium fredii NGR234]|uniref:Transcriptional regulator LysR n=1 Tax=Sinorhizobium fredii (strain NBRC 101917 / NGR234) TaxID=394 RepID=Q6W1G3_SINFN|nr:LysR family transcriptional regulator [Sinorhizobium fredii]AAQ87405.1 Transcriptional regulators, LysR family [Sinorhizobium fredii NGR234]ACP21945.1 putative transcriptional regulator LysR [Sinorhizobium fredii NGR234]
MPHPIDLKTLRAFVAVAREGNVTRASEQLHLTQPALSQHLKRLASDTGVTLFRRTSKGLELTHQGALLAAKAEQVFAALQDFGQTARHLGAQVRGKLRIGTIIDPEFTRLGGFLKALVDSGPGIETELRHGMSGDVPEGLRRNELDVGFFLGDIRDFDPVASATADGSDSLFHVRELARLTYRVVAPPSLAAFVRGQDWVALAALPWIGTPHASVHNRLLSEVFGKLGVRQNIVASVDQEPSMLAMVRTGLGLSLCRESLALHEQQAHGLVIADKVAIETALSFVCLGARMDDPAIKIAFDAVNRVWN